MEEYLDASHLYNLNSNNNASNITNFNARQYISNNELQNLLSNNNSLKNQNEYLLQIIEKLKNQIEDKGKEFFYLEKEYDENKEIKIDNHTFKGYINKMSKWLIIDLNIIFVKNLSNNRDSVSRPDCRFRRGRTSPESYKG